MYVTKQTRGMGDTQPLVFPFLSTLPACQVGGLDPITGDTIANCPSSPASPALPVLSDSMTVTAAGYPTWAYVAAGTGAVLLLSMLFGGGRRRY